MHSLKLQKVKALHLRQKTKLSLKNWSKTKNIYLGDIDVSKIKSFKDLFKNSRRRDFSGIETWDTSKVTDMQSCFEEAEFFNHDIQYWNVSKVESMERMFYGARSFNQPPGAWGISSVYNFTQMFMNSESFDQNLESWGEKSF
ncbi:BspA family leucine-rich repeat surface protein [Helicobacter trogontum]|uniref:BspA family leucine-rich repeat surface protein n=1 Tax=Helicobacter trogontum TaxID=50960 RepID=A0A4U8S2R8_9HELI|nr:BspA family leucine-rich repeat surface protein [Helicobacter trogontum]TLD80018.1 BspA family leucine-rich repeat surface protein [Helicobacter trogontum]